MSKTNKVVIAVVVVLGTGLGCVQRQAHLLCMTPVGVVSLDRSDTVKFRLQDSRVILQLPDSTVSLPAEMCIIEIKK